MNVSDIMRKLKKLGCSIEYGDGSTAKIYPPDKNQPFYSFHIGEKGLHPLRRFAKKNWNLDLRKI